MKYFILPIIVIGYILWTYFSIKELHRCKWRTGPKAWKEGIYTAPYSTFWIILHFAILSEAIIVFIGYYW